MHEIGVFMVAMPSNLDTISLHGLVAFSSAENRISRGFWLIIYTLAFAIAIYQCSRLIGAAQSSLTITKIEFEQNVPLTFPTIMLCNGVDVGFLNYSKLNHSGVSVEAAASMTLAGPLMMFQPAKFLKFAGLNDKAISYQNSLSLEYSNSLESLKDFLINYTIACEDFFLFCAGGNLQKLNCCDIFKPIIALDRGLCYASDSSQIPKSSVARLFSKFEFSLSPVTNSLGFNTNPRARLIVGDRFQGFLVSSFYNLYPGQFRFVNLASIHLHYMQRGENLCVVSDKLQYFADYNFENCIWERYYMGNILKKTKCTPASFYLTKLGFNWPKATNIGKICNFTTVIKEIFNLTNTADFSTDLTYWMSLVDLTNVKNSLCPPLCVRNSYSYTTESIPELPKFEGTNNSRVILTFSDQQRMRIWERPGSDWTDYLSLIGGTLGLWLGASLLTFVEIFYQIANMTIAKLSTKYVLK